MADTTMLRARVAEVRRQRLTRAFRELRRRGYFARQNFRCCQSCAWADVPDAQADRAVFYHAQDAAYWRDRGETYLAWAGDGAEIVAVLREHGLAVEWDGSPDTRILVKEVADA